MNNIACSAKIYREVQLQESMVGEYCSVGDYCILKNVKMQPYSVFDRRCFAVKTSLGTGSSIGMNSVVKNVDIGNYCNIAWNVSIGGSNHDYKCAAMGAVPRWNSLFGTALEDKRERPYCSIGNDVWIGSGASIVTGVRIGNGAVIASGAIVVKDVEPFAIVGGCPARLIKYRFNEEIRNALDDLGWWNWDMNTIRDASSLLHESPLTMKTIELLRELHQS